ncbi:hypothetical protein VTO73DRAFT_10898 [Trametes versicolor]
MTPILQTKPEDIETPDLAAPYDVVLPETPSLSCSDPTPPMDVEPIAESHSLAQDGPSALPEIVVDPLDPLDAPDASEQPRTVPATHRPSARRITSSGSASGMLKALGKQRVTSAAINRIGERFARVTQLTQEIPKRAKLLREASTSLMGSFESLGLPSHFVSPMPRDVLLDLVGRLTAPAVIAQFDTVEEHINVIRSGVEEMDKALKEIGADAKELKLDTGELSFATWTGYDIEKFKADLAAPSGMLRLFAAIRVEAAAGGSEPLASGAL